MNESLIKLNEQKREDLVKSLASDAVQKLFASIKAASDSDSGTFRVIVSTADFDRQGESVNQNGWDLSFYKSNPVVLWGHDYGSLPIGYATSIEVQDGKLIAEGKFAPADANPFAQQVRRLYDLGMVRATSVGFIPREFDTNNDRVISKAELLEFSFVPVPANPHALTMNQIKELGIDTMMLKIKGIEITAKVEATNKSPMCRMDSESEDDCVARKVKEIMDEDSNITQDQAVAMAKDMCSKMCDEKSQKAEVKETVSDALDEMKVREAKWKNYQQMMMVIDAFCTAYFDDSTPVEKFTELLNEAADILKSMAGTDADMKSISEKILKIQGDRKSVRESIDNNIKVLREAFENIAKNFALGSVMRAEGNDGSQVGKDAEIERSKESKGLSEIDNFIETRNLLKLIDNSVEKVLRGFNEAARKHASRPN